KSCISSPDTCAIRPRCSAISSLVRETFTDARLVATGTHACLATKDDRRFPEVLPCYDKSIATLHRPRGCWCRSGSHSETSCREAARTHRDGCARVCARTHRCRDLVFFLP